MNLSVYNFEFDLNFYNNIVFFKSYNLNGFSERVKTSIINIQI